MGTDFTYLLKNYIGSIKVKPTEEGQGEFFLLSSKEQESEEI